MAVVCPSQAVSGGAYALRSHDSNRLLSNSRDFIVPFAHAMAAYAHALEQGVNAAFVLGADAHPEHHFTASSILLIQRALATPPVLPPARTVVDWSWYEQEEQPQFRVDL